MANATRNGRRRQPPSELDPCQQDLAEAAEGTDGSTGESRSTLETPNLWHAGARSECWTGSGIKESSASWASPFAAPRRPALRLRRSSRRRTTLHCSRPFQVADARFVSPLAEFLAD